jgi:hypothetical protein
VRMLWFRNSLRVCEKLWFATMGFSETFFFVVCDDIWIAIYPSFVVVVVHFVEELDSCSLIHTR